MLVIKSFFTNRFFYHVYSCYLTARRRLSSPIFLCLFRHAHKHRLRSQGFPISPSEHLLHNSCHLTAVHLDFIAADVFLEKLKRVGRVIFTTFGVKISRSLRHKKSITTLSNAGKITLYVIMGYKSFLQVHCIFSYICQITII